MPRVENLGKNVSEWCEETGEGSSTHDICNDCNAELAADPHALDCYLEPYNGDEQGDEGWGGDVERPSYDEWDIDYNCEACAEKLTEDNAG